MPPLEQWLLNVRYLSPWIILGILCATSAIVSWGYLRVIGALPWLNRPVLAVGFLLLVLESFIEVRGLREGAPNFQTATVAALMGLGGLLFSLGLVGRWYVRRASERELLRRQIWDRYSSL